MSDARDISGTQGSGGILCPFYVANGSMDIICQGIIPDTTNQIRYKIKTDKITQQKAFCEGCYKRCEIYIAIQHFRYFNEEET